jgi:hypothetical protein
MTEFNLLSTVVGGILLALVVAASLIFLPTILETETDLKTSAQSIAVIDAAHLAESCLGPGGIPESLLESSAGSRICSVCSDKLAGLCENRIDFGFKVKDLESSKEWNFGYSGSEDHTAEIFVNILHDTGETSIGRLYAGI